MKRKRIKIAIIVALIGSFGILMFGNTKVKPCQNDINSDGRINGADREYLLSCYGTDCSKAQDCILADLNNDGLVDVQDLNILIASMGLDCK